MGASWGKVRIHCYCTTDRHRTVALSTINTVLITSSRGSYMEHVGAHFTETELMDTAVLRGLKGLNSVCRENFFDRSLWHFLKDKIWQMRSQQTNVWCHGREEWDPAKGQ